MTRKKFELKSGNSPSFKMVGLSPSKDKKLREESTKKDSSAKFLGKLGKAALGPIGLF